MKDHPLSDELIPHVTHNGEWIEWLPRHEIHDRKLVHRSIQALIFHPDGRLLIQLRHRAKRTHPHHWDVSCSGHVDQSDHPGCDGTRAIEAFWSSVRRELFEEIGVLPDLELLGLYPPIAQVNYEYSAIFTGVSEGPFTIQNDELEEVRWVTESELRQITPLTGTLQWLLDSGLIWKPK